MISRQKVRHRKRNKNKSSFKTQKLQNDFFFFQIVTFQRVFSRYFTRESEMFGRVREWRSMSNGLKSMWKTLSLSGSTNRTRSRIRSRVGYNGTSTDRSTSWSTNTSNNTSTSTSMNKTWIRVRVQVLARMNGHSLAYAQYLAHLMLCKMMVIEILRVFLKHIFQVF